MADAPSAHIDLEMRTAAFRKQIGSVKKMLGGLRQGLQRTAQAAKRMLLVGGLGFGGLLKIASDFEEFSSKFEAVFKDLSGEARDWVNETAKLLQRSEIDLIKYMGTLQDTFVPFGFARREAMKMSKAVTQLGIDLASFNNMADAEVINALTSALVGNHEAVRRFGVLITATTLEQELFRLGIEGGSKAATEQQKVLARLNLIMGMTADAQGDAAKTAGSFANQIKGLIADAKNLAITLGNFFIPQMKILIADVREFVPRILDWVKGNKDLIVSTAKWAAGLGVAVIALNGLVFALSGAKIAAVALFGNPMLAAISAFVLAVVAAEIAVIKLNAAMAASEEESKRFAAAEARLAAAERDTRSRDPIEKAAGIRRQQAALKELITLMDARAAAAKRERDRALDLKTLIKSEAQDARDMVAQQTTIMLQAERQANQYREALKKVTLSLSGVRQITEETRDATLTAAEVDKRAAAITAELAEQKERLEKIEERRARRKATRDAISLAHEKAIMALNHELAILQGTMTRQEVRRAQLRMTGLRPHQVRKRLELERQILEAQKEAARIESRRSFTSAIEGATAVFRRIQVAAAGGATADPGGKARAALEAQKRGNILSKDQKTILTAIKDRLDAMKVAFS